MMKDNPDFNVISHIGWRHVQRGFEALASMASELMTHLISYSTEVKELKTIDGSEVGIKDEEATTDRAELRQASTINELQGQETLETDTQVRLTENDGQLGSIQEDGENEEFKAEKPNAASGSKLASGGSNSKLETENKVTESDTIDSQQRMINALYLPTTTQTETSINDEVLVTDTSTHNPDRRKFYAHKNFRTIHDNDWTDIKYRQVINFVLGPITMMLIFVRQAVELLPNQAHKKFIGEEARKKTILEEINAELLECRKSFKHLLNKLIQILADLHNYMSQAQGYITVKEEFDSMYDPDMFGIDMRAMQASVSTGVHEAYRLNLMHAIKQVEKKLSAFQMIEFKS